MNKKFILPTVAIMFMLTGCSGSSDDNALADMTAQTGDALQWIDTDVAYTDANTSQTSAAETSGEISVSEVTEVSDSSLSTDVSGSGESSVTYQTSVVYVDENGNIITETPNGVTNVAGINSVTVTSVTQSVVSNDGTPPLTDAQKTLYSAAKIAYENVVYGLFEADRTQDVWIDGKNGYVMLQDSRFSSAEDVKTYLYTYFTKDYVDTVLMPSNQVRFVERYGNLYMLSESKQQRTDYAGHVFEITYQDDVTIRLKATIYHYNDGTSNQTPFYSAPSADVAARCTTEEVFFTVSWDASANQWKFSEFSAII